MRSSDRPPLAKVLDKSRWLASNEVSCNILGIVMGGVPVPVPGRESRDWDSKFSVPTISLGNDRFVGVVELPLLCPG